MLKNEEIISKINDFARRSEPFVFAVNFEGSEGFVLSPEEASEKGVYFKTTAHSNYTHEEITTAKPTFNIYPPSFDAYEKAFNKVRFHLQRGDTYLINLTFPTKIETESSLDDIFHHSHAQYKLLVPGTFTVFSPETFIKIKDGSIYTYPMKGTIDASIPDAEQIIMNSLKEKYEHNTIVDLLRNDLSMVAVDVRVKRFRYIQKIRTQRNELLQVSSEITGKLPEDFRQHLGNIIFTLLPAGSVSGAPKARTVEILKAVENYERGFYTGIFGHYNGAELDAAVMIRFIEDRGDGLYYKSGGGITTQSNAAEEYDELIKKIYVPVI